MRIQLFYVKPDSKEICKIVKECHSSHYFFCSEYIAVFHLFNLINIFFAILKLINSLSFSQFYFLIQQIYIGITHINKRFWRSLITFKHAERVLRPKSLKTIQYLVGTQLFIEVIICIIQSHQLIHEYRPMNSRRVQGKMNGCKRRRQKSSLKRETWEKDKIISN